jgi:hypothetical protein|tara:strand:+ start:25 stop:222 length:198 start_codon:yes stop_codon:yes gene_type:complete
MNKNFVIAFISQDKDIIIEPLAKFNGDTMYFNKESEAREYISRLYTTSSIENMDFDDGLSIIRVQ